MNRKTVYACLGLLFAARPALGGDINWPEGAGLLVDHQPYHFGGLASDTLFSEVPGGQPFPWQLVADDFSLAQTSTIDYIVYWGFYNSNLPPTTDETMRIRFYDARPSDGLPGDVLYEASFLNPPREWTGRNVIAFGGGPELRFEVLLDQPFSADANTTYWFEVVQIGDLSSAYRAEFSATSPLNGQAFSNPNFPNWTHTTSITSNTAFQLYSIPEPTSLSLSVLGALAFSSGALRRIVRRSLRR